MKTSSVRTLLGLVLAAWIGVSAASGQTPVHGPLSAKTRAQLDAIHQEAAARTPTQRKITWSLLYAAKERATRSAPVPGAPKLHSHATLEADGRTKVRIKAHVTPELLGLIRTLGGDVTASQPKYRVIYATVPLESLEPIAERPEVEFIDVPPSVDFNGRGQTALERAIGNTVNATATVNDPEGDAAHGANIVRGQYPTADGQGLKVAVISNSLDNASSDYEAALLNGYVSTVTVPTGQAGTSATDDAEGLAMLEVVHRLAPAAQLYFATADNGEEQMAANIATLVADGCNIIIDDIAYSDESPFQDDTISQAIDAAAARGVLYFSCSANYGNQDSGTSSCWEGDFVGVSNFPTLLNFGTSSSPAVENYVASQNPSVNVELFWADPLGKAASSYFLVELDYEGDVIQEANDEGVNPMQTITGFTPGDYAGVVMNSGSPLFLHLDIAAQNSSLEFSTAGRVRGHNGCASAFTVAATPAAAPAESGGPSGPYPSEFSSADQVETFSDDGPRRIFFTPAGAPITPGNFSSTGGQLLAKPDFTAADGVSTSVGTEGGGLNPFFGTSCAAPHAGAIAAMLLSYNPALSAAQIGAALRGGTVQVTNPGAGNRDAGAGILLAPNVIQAVNTPPSIISFSPANGPAGTIVTVTGINLNTTVAAAINGVPAAFAVISSSAVTVTVPAGVTTGPITIATAGGVARSAANFTPTASVSTPVISSPGAASGQVGSPFSYQITATNGPTSFAASGLPPGLGVSASGLISGIPAAPGAFPVTIAAGNAPGGASSASLTITILPAPPAITSPSAATAQVGVAFGFQLSGSNGPTGFSATGLPPGLVFNPASGVIAGTPAIPGTFTATVSATNAGGTSSATLTLTVLPAAPVITSPLSAPGEQGKGFGYQITASNSPTAFGAAGLPPGLTVNPANGVISGVPAVYGSFQVTVSAGNAGGVGSAVLTLAFVVAPPVITSPAAVAAREDVAFGFQVGATGSPTAFGASGLPAGLVINPTSGVISGTPLVEGTYHVTVAAANATGTGTALLAIVVAAPPLPTVTLNTPIASVHAGGAEDGEFLVSLSHAVKTEVTVAFTITGSAVNGSNYDKIKATVQIPAGKTSKVIKIVPIDDFAGTKAVQLALEKRPAYDLGNKIRGKVKIIGNQ